MEVASFSISNNTPAWVADEPSSASANIFIIDRAEVHDAGELVRVKFSAGQRVFRRRRGAEEPPGLVVHVPFRKAFAVKVVGVSFHGYVNSRQPPRTESLRYPPRQPL